jgi:hypothetical protein
VAGSNPNWVTGYVPSASEWNTLWSGKADYSSGGLAAINVLDYLTGGQPDGTTDNTAQLQAAINASVGKVVYFPKTTNNYIVKCVNVVLDGVNGRAALLIPSNVHIIIDGYVFLQASSPGGNISGMFYTNGTSNIVLEGAGTIDGNKVNQIAGNLGHQCCIRTSAGSNILIRGLTLLNSSGSNLNVLGTSGVLVDGINQSGAVFASQFTAVQGGLAPTNCWIRNSNLSCSTDFAWAFYDGCSNSGIVNCTLDNAVAVLTDGGSLFCNNILIDANIIKVTGGAVTVYVSNVVGTQTYINISNNQIISDRTVGNSQVSITQAAHVTITDNVVMATAATHAGVAGIFIDGSTTDYLISGNLVRNCLNGIALYTALNGMVVDNIISNSNNNGAAGTGIIIHSTCSNTIISRNHLYDDQGSPTQTSGIIDDGTSPGAGAIITHNIIANASTPYTIHPLSDTILVKYGTTTGVVDFTAAKLRGAAWGAYGEFTLASSAQTVSANTSTKVALDTTIYDTAGAWDNANSRYTANIAGKYIVMVCVAMTTTAATAGNPWKASVYKNGTEVAHATLTAPNGNSAVETMQ